MGMAVPAAMDGREARATLVGASVVVAFTLAVLATGRVPLAQFAQLFGIYAGGTVAVWTVLGVITFFVQVFRSARVSRGEPFLGAMVGEFIAGRWRRDRFASLLWPPLMFATLLASFNSFKQLVLPLAGFRFDAAFAAGDRMLFLGQDPWRVTHAILGSDRAILAVDRLYHGWFAPMMIGVILCAWLPASSYRLRTQYLLSYISVWILLGSVLAFLFPSAGPCFYSELVGPAPQFDALLQRLHDVEAATGSPLLALHNQATLLHAFHNDRLALGGGISAMPSVHNGLAVLFAIASWRVSRPLGILFAAYAVMIWIGSIHLGWHYALDGIVAAVLTAGIWRFCGRIAERLERPLLPAPTAPALA
jgi:PAP2 superfamily protein